MKRNLYETDNEGHKAIVAKLSAAQLTKALATAGEMVSAAGRKMIDAGRGHEKYSETMAKAGGDDELANEFKAVADHETVLRQERQWREYYHGSLKPVPGRPGPL